MAATPTYGRIDAFCPQQENITTYLERVDAYFTANKVPEAEQAAVLLSCIDRKTYGILKSLVAPEIPKSKTFVELKEQLESHFAPSSQTDSTSIAGDSTQESLLQNSPRNSAG